MRIRLGRALIFSALTALLLGLVACGSAAAPPAAPVAEAPAEVPQTTAEPAP